MNQSFQHPLVIAAGVLLVAAFVFFAAVQALMRPSMATNSGTNQIVERGSPVGTSTKKTLPTGTPNPADKLAYVPQGVAPTAGTVQSVGANSFVMAPVTPGGGTGATVTVNVTSATEFFKQGQLKDAATYQKEVDAFNSAMQYSTDSTHVYFSPDRYTHVPLTFNDVKAGAVVFMVSRGVPVSGEVTATAVQVIQ
jgi:hypothetical protein